MAVDAAALIGSQSDHGAHRHTTLHDQTVKDDGKWSRAASMLQAVVPRLLKRGPMRKNDTPV